MTTKFCKVLRGSIEIPRLDADGNQMAWPDHSTIGPGETFDLDAAEADRLLSLGAVEILPTT
jgi:hypothetical protein